MFASPYVEVPGTLLQLHVDIAKQHWAQRSEKGAFNQLRIAGPTIFNGHSAALKQVSNPTTPTAALKT